MLPNTQTSLPDRRRAILFTAGVVSLAFAWMHFPSPLRGTLPWILMSCSGMLLLAVSRFRLRHPVPALELALILFPFLSMFFFRFVCPSTRVASVDELLWVFDSAFGYPQLPLTRLFAASTGILTVCNVTYQSLPFTFAVTYLLLPAAIRPRYLCAIAAAGAVVLPFYMTCPGAGPAYVFGHAYPNAMPLLAEPHARLLPAGNNLNTTPSDHLTWALLLFWFTWRYCGKPIAACFGLFSLVMVAATLGLGEHYVIDLVMAVPFAAAIWFLTGRQWRHAAAMLAVVGAWCIVLRQGWLIGAPAPLVWALSAATLAAPLVRRVRFETAPLALRPRAWRTAA